MEGLRIIEADWANWHDTIAGIRFRVFVDEQKVPRELELDGRDPDCRHLLAEVPGAGFVGTARLLPDDHIGRVAVLPGFRGRGIGRDMMVRLIGLARSLGHPEVILHAQESVVPFYRGLGFHAEGEPFFEADIPHRLMRLSLGPSRP